MSTAPKRSHEEGGHSSSSTKYPPHEEGNSHPNVASNMGQDSRVGKVSRSDPRDTDRRSPLHSMYRVPSSSMSDSHVNRLVGGPDNRLESRDHKEVRENKVENRDAKAELKEPHHRSSNTEKEVRPEGRGDDNKEMKHERVTHNDQKSVMKQEKVSYGAADSQSNWKEHHRGKRYPDAPNGTGGPDPWSNMRPSAHGSPTVVKEGLINDERKHVDTNEAILENKPDLKGDDKYKDKDRKKKEVKHRELGERDKDRSDRKTSLQICCTGNDSKEPATEVRESDRCEKERKYILKEKERSKEREKDFANRETRNALEKEGSQVEMETVDRPSEPNILALEQKSTKETDVRKNAERECRERRKERDGDVEGQRPEKRSRLNDKEFDEGGGDVEGDTGRDRDAFNCGAQQRKRMLRPRASPQRANRSRSQSQDADGSQGKTEVSSVVYRVGECMQELIKLWKEYESSQAEKNGGSAHEWPTLEILIPAEHVTATNRQVRCGQLWGTDIYTNDSDLVAVLMHTGYCRPTAMPPPSAIQELRATVRVLPPQDCYVSTLRNNVRSRAWGAAIGCSYRVECCCIVKKGGGTIDLEPCLTHTSTVEPTLAPVAVERTMTTRASASNSLRQQRFVREVTIQYNLCNEPWIKYSISIVADKGLKKPLYTSARLKKGEVLYLETHSCRYELCFAGEKVVKTPTTSNACESDAEKSQNHSWHHMNGDRSLAECESVIDVFRWSKCKRPLPQNVMRSIGIPLPLEHVEVLEENLDWEDILWSQTGVWIAGKEYHLARVHFLSPN